MYAFSQEELHSSKDALAAAKDEVAQWQDRAAELGKELEAAKKKARKGFEWAVD